ncbi:MAG: hypothetical protein AAFY28_21995, partial [Actinomycetota bacterium]
ADFEAWAAFTDDEPWEDLDGNTIFSSNAGLKLDPLHPLAIDENGDAAMTQAVWTGANGQDCDNWSSESSSGGFGLAQTGTAASWWDFTTATCDALAAIYCLEIST